MRRPDIRTGLTGLLGLAMLALPASASPTYGVPLAAIGALALIMAAIAPWEWPATTAAAIAVGLTALANPGPLTALGYGLPILLYVAAAHLEEVRPARAWTSARPHVALLGALPAGLVVAAAIAVAPPPSLWLVLAGLVAAPLCVRLVAVTGHATSPHDTRPDGR